MECFCRSVIKEFAHALAVRISTYGCTWEVWRALKKLELLILVLRFFRALQTSARSITRYTHAKHEEILIFFRGHPQKSTVLQLSIYSDSQTKPINPTYLTLKTDTRGLFNRY